MEARRILSYFEHVAQDQQPPKSIWHSRKKCAAWIDSHRPGEQGQSSGSGIWFKDSEVERSN